MAVIHSAALAAAALGSVILSACTSPPRAGGIMSYDQYRLVEHENPYVLDGQLGDAALRYYGAAHFGSPDDPQAGDLEAAWTIWQPDFALNEGGDPPVEVTPEIAIGRHGESGLLRWLAARDGVPIESLDPSLAQEVAALRDRFALADLKTFYVLRGTMQDARRDAVYRELSVDEAATRLLSQLGAVPGLEGEPRTLAEFEEACRARAPGLTNWRQVPPEWFDPALESSPAFTNAISRALSEYRDRFIVETLLQSLREHKRVFAVVGSSHVVMQEPELRARLDTVRGPFGVRGDVIRSNRQIISLLVEPLTPPPISAERQEELARKLATYADRARRADAGEDDFIWLGRTLAYFHRYGEAIEVFDEGLRRFPDSWKLLRHRGHRYITVRRFDLAAIDLQRAADLIESRRIADEVEPDGAPNRFSVPRSTINTNIYYHLGLAHYLQGDFARSADVFAKCLSITPNDDMTVATTHWLYMSLRRDGRADDARAALASIGPQMEIMENETYWKLCRMYQGELTPEQVMGSDAGDLVGAASAGYGVANWHWCEGRRDQAAKMLRQAADSPLWPAFGVIAAESDVVRLQLE